MRRPLGRSSLTVSSHSFGAAPIGNLGREVDPQVAADAVDAAWNAGVRYFDVAPHYGLGVAEARLGEALQDRPRDEYVISTKVGRLLVDGGVEVRDDEGFAVNSRLRRQRDYSRDGVLRSIEASLRRLQLDRLDVVYVHDPDDYFREALDGAFPALDDLRREGVIRSYGAGMNQAEMLTAFVRETDADVIMCAGRYTLLDRSGEELLDLCATAGVSVVAAGAFNSGLLASERPSPTATFDYAAAPEDLFRRAELMAATCTAAGSSLPAAAAQFPLRHPAVATVCLGSRTRQHVERNARLFEETIPEELWKVLDEC